MPKIFESPDGGKTVYEREMGSAERQFTQDTLARMKEDKMWGEIRRMALVNPTLKDAVDRVIMLYKLIKERE